MNQEDELIENYTYRGFTFPIYLDEPGQCYYTIWEGKEISFGTFNTNYQDDIEYLVNDKLDTIERFPHGGKLSWFENGFSGYTDIKLEYRTRIIYIWLVKEPNLVNLEIVKTEAAAKLEKIQRQDANVVEIIEAD